MKNLFRFVLGRTVSLLLRGRSQPYPFPPGQALIVAPHADDETLGCGGLLAAKCARGDAVQVVFLSDSAGSPEENPPADQAARRRREALAALAALGVSAECVHFIDAPDGRLNRLSATERARVENACIRLLHQFKPAEIFLPYFGGGSSEHDAAVQLVRAGLTRSDTTAQIWEFPIWAWWDARRLMGQLSRPRQNAYLALGATRARKQEALACHASQLQPASPTGEPPLPPVLGALCTGPWEFFFHRNP